MPVEKNSPSDDGVKPSEQDFELQPPRIDSDIAALLAGRAASPGGPDILSAIRSRPVVAPLPLSDDVERSDHTVPGRPGSPDIAIRIHRPRGLRGQLPCVYAIHGGGYIAGSYLDLDGRFDEWCTRHRFIGASIEYRLSPETPYPGPLDDCYAGLEWLHRNAEFLGINRACVGVMGASAGGGLAAALALRARDEGRLPIAFQLLVYPMIDDRQITRSSKINTPIWGPAANEFGWRSYLGTLYGSSSIPYYAAPSRALALSHLPPTFITVGSADGFHDEDIDYANRLNRSGVLTELHVYPGAPHGFDNEFSTAPVARRARLTMEEWLHWQLHSAQHTSNLDARGHTYGMVEG